MKRIASLFCLLLLTSCASTFVEKEESWNPKEEVPALMVHYSFVDNYSLSQGKSLGDAVRDVLTASQGGKSPLEQSGEKVFARIKPIFSHYNMKLYFDRKSASKAAEITGVFKAERGNNKGSGQGFLSDGDWLHPETVEEPFHMAGTLFQGKYYQQIAKSTLKENNNGVAVSMGVTVEVDSSWLLGWKCKASLRARALNQEGKPVFLVSSAGESTTYWFGGKNRYLIEACPEAAEDALARLATKIKPGT